MLNYNIVQPFPLLMCCRITAWRAQGVRLPADFGLQSLSIVTTGGGTVKHKHPDPRQHQRYHSQHYPRQQLAQDQPSVMHRQQTPQHQSVGSTNSLQGKGFPRSSSGVLAPGRRAIVTHGETAVPCRVTLYGADTQGVEKGLETLVPPPQFRLVPVNPPAAASWHLKVTAGQTEQRLRYVGGEGLPGGSSPTGDWQQDKPKSWDNLLSTKSFGGYGFGYGFIDVNSSHTSCKVTQGARSVSTNRLNEDTDAIETERKCSEVWTGTEGSRTVPRHMKTAPPPATTSSSENLVTAGPDVSSCFSCDCMGLDHVPLETCVFSKPRSTESLLAPTLHAAPSETSIVDTTVTPTPHRRRSRTSSLANCLGKRSPPDQMTHL